MKNFILYVLIVFSGKLGAQLVFEHKYDSASTAGVGTNSKVSQLMKINFEVSGERYVLVNRAAKRINLYNLSHQLVKSVDISFVPTEPPPYDGIYDVLYLSEHLFNMDSKMEFMVCVTVGQTYTTMVFQEDGTQLFNDPGVPAVKPNYHQQQYPIYNTAQGTKLILSYKNGDGKVFGLGGTLTTAIQKPFEGQMEESSLYVSASRPNPSTEGTTINFNLPAQSNGGTIILYDLNGKELRRVRLEQGSNEIQLTTRDLAAGTYLYQLECEGQISGSRKLVVIK